MDRSHIYIMDRENNQVIVEAKDSNGLFQIQQLETPGGFEKNYFIMYREDKYAVPKDEWLGYYPACWEPYVV